MEGGWRVDGMEGGYLKWKPQSENTKLTPKSPSLLQGLYGGCMEGGCDGGWIDGDGWVEDGWRVDSVCILVHVSL